MQRIGKISRLIVTYVSAFMLILSYLSVHVNPETFWFLGLFGLAYPLFLLLNFILFIYWIVRWERYFLIPLITIIIGFSHLSNFFQPPFSKEKIVDENSLKVVTYNVNLFRLYAWSKEPPSHKEIFQLINQHEPHIVCLQEFYTDGKNLTSNAAKNLISGNVHIGEIIKKQGTSYGLATYSHYPIINRGMIKFSDSFNACIYTDIQINNDTVRVYNTHFQSLRLKEKNLNFLLSQSYRKEADTMDEIRDISFRYRDALKKRARQVKLVTDHILNSPYPAIVCGDFNESPISYNYHKMRKNLDDAFVEAGNGVGHTYSGFLPSFRIDYVLYNHKYKAVEYLSPKVDYSDHYPVITTLVSKEE